MKKHISLAVFAVFSYTYAVMSVPDAEPGYSQTERGSMNRLVEKATAKPQAGKGMPEDERARVLKQLFGG